MGKKAKRAQAQRQNLAKWGDLKSLCPIFPEDCLLHPRNDLSHVAIADWSHEQAVVFRDTIFRNVPQVRTGFNQQQLASVDKLLDIVIKRKAQPTFRPEGLPVIGSLPSHLTAGQISFASTLEAYASACLKGAAVGGDGGDASVSAELRALQLGLAALVPIAHQIPAATPSATTACLSAGAPVVKKFLAGLQQCGMSLSDVTRQGAEDQQHFIVAFHGTRDAGSVLCHGFDPSKRSGQMYGRGEYFAEDWATASTYAGKKSIVGSGSTAAVVVTLIIKEKAKRARTSWYVVDNPADGAATFCLPITALSADPTVKDWKLPPCVGCHGPPAEPSVAPAKRAAVDGSTTAKTTVVAPPIVEFFNEKSTWVAMDATTAAAILAARGTAKGDVASAVYTRRAFKYDIDFGRMVQINTSTTVERPLRFHGVSTAEYGPGWSIDVEFKNDKGNFTAMARAHAAAINAARSEATIAQVFTRGRFNYDVDLQRMVQINNTTGTERLLRLGATVGGTDAVAVEFKNDKGDWAPMEAADAASVVAGFAGVVVSNVYTRNSFKYDIDFGRMVQMNTSTKVKRELRLVARRAPDFGSGKDKWRKMSSKDTATVAIARSGAPQSGAVDAALATGGHVYNYDFNRMVQTNASTGMRRRIQFTP